MSKEEKDTHICLQDEMEKSIFQFLEIRKVAMNMIYRKLYPCSQDEFKEKFIKKTIDPSCFNKIRMSWSAEINKRVYLRKLDNCRFDLYSWPDRMGPWFSKPWIFPWRGMSMWAAPAHAYGTIYNSKNETIIDYCIKKTSG